MAKDDDDGGDLKSLIMKARQGPINFGVCLGSKPEDTVFNAHRKKSPDVLEREAKKEGGTTKTVGGSLVIEGTEAKLTCLGDAPAGTAKKLSVFFKKVVGIKLKVILLDPAGLMLESGDADEDGPDGGSEVVPEAPPVPPEAENAAVIARFDAALKKLLPAVQAAIAASPSAREILLQLVTAVRKGAADGNEAEAKTRIEQIVAVLGKLGASGAGQPQGGSGGVSVVKLGKARLEWANTRLQGISGIERLKTAIADDYADMPEAGDAVRAALGRLDRLVAQIDARLQDELDAVLNAPAEARGPLAERVRGTISGFSAMVDKDPILAALDGNEFVPELSVAAPLRAKLAEISAALG